MELLTVDETAQVLKVSRVTVRRFISRGELRFVQIGRQRRIEREEVERFVRGNSHPIDDVPDEVRDAPPLMPDDPILGLIGIGKSEGPGVVARNKQSYLAEAYVTKGLPSYSGFRES